MKKAYKITFAIIINLCICLFSPSVESLVSRGQTEVRSLFALILINIVITNTVFLIVAKKWDKISQKTKMRIKGITLAVFLVFASVGLVVPFSDSYDLLKITSNDVPESAVIEVPLGDGAFLEIYKSTEADNFYRCAVIRKTPFSFFTYEPRFYWQPDKLEEDYLKYPSSDGTYYKMPIPEAYSTLEHDNAVFLATWHNEEVAEVYANNKKMNIISTDEFNFAYLIINNSEDDFKCTLKDKNGETVGFKAELN